MPDSIPRWKPPIARCRPAKEVAHYKTADWESTRARILLRDAYRCCVCRAVVHGRAAHVDHIVPLEDGGTDADTNLQTLCSSHHGAKTRSEQRRRGFA